MSHKILIVEDDKEIRTMLADFLEQNGYEVWVAAEGLAASAQLKERQYDLILMDLMLPFISGEQLIAELRKTSQTPVVVLSAKTMLETRLEVLRLGADDYMEKPFDSKELVARAKAILRRVKPVASAAPAKNVKSVSYPDLEISLTNYSVTYMNQRIDMPPKELELLYFMASSPNHVFTREQLLDQIWGYEYIGDTRTVDVHIKRLREKIKDHNAWRIATIWGIGYKFEVK